MISQGVRVVYREPVMATLAKGVTSGEIYANDPHGPEDLQPMQRPALLAGIATQWHLWAEKAYPRMLHVAFPTGVFSLVNNHRKLLFLLGALHVCGAKPLHFHAGPKRVAEMEATAPQPGSRTPPVPSAQSLEA